MKRNNQASAEQGISCLLFLLYYHGIDTGKYAAPPFQQALVRQSQRTGEQRATPSTVHTTTCLDLPSKFL